MLTLQSEEQTRRKALFAVRSDLFHVLCVRFFLLLMHPGHTETHSFCYGDDKLSTCLLTKFTEEKCVLAVIWSCVTLTCNHNDMNKKQQTARLISLALEIESKLFPIIVASQQFKINTPH